MSKLNNRLATLDTLLAATRLWSPEQLEEALAHISNPPLAEKLTSFRLHEGESHTIQPIR